jgi:DNA (cytosine-5)-methyltransferase 1
MNELALFAGAGGGILGGQLLGWRTVCAVERDPYAASVLLARQNDGFLPAFPIWDDVRTFDGRPWRGIVDVVSGGFPCQDISAAGKGAGITGERSGLWAEMARIIGEVRPRYAFVENSPLLTSRGLDVVLGDLASMGYDARWGVLGAYHAGAPHKRDRIWIVASDPLRDRYRIAVQQEHIEGGCVTPDVGSNGEICDVAYTDFVHVQGQLAGSTDTQGRQEPERRSVGSCSDGTRWWATEPDVGRVVDEFPDPLDFLGDDER